MRARLMCVLAVLTVGQTARPVVAEAANISAIGNEAPIAIAVSPLYARSGMVAALAVPVGGCRAACMHLWITRNGGASWHRAPAVPPASGLVIVAGPHGADRLVGSRDDGVVVSDDDGSTWRVVGPTGTPVAAPQLGADAVLVAGHGGEDWVLRGDTRHALPGSGGNAIDVTFATVGDNGGPNLPPMLLARNRTSGLSEVLRCDAVLACAGAAPLPGSTPTGGEDMSLLSTAAGVYARSSTTLYRSDDGGGTFLALALPSTAGARYTAIAAVTSGGGRLPDVDVALLDVLDPGGTQRTSGGVFASPDRGVTWGAVGSPGVLDGGATAVVAAPGGRLFAGYVNGDGQAGLVCDDGGGRWQATCGTAVRSCPAVRCATSSPSSAVSDATNIAATSVRNSTTARDTRRPPRRETAILTGGQARGATAVMVSAASIACLTLALASVAFNTRRRRRR